MATDNFQLSPASAEARFQLLQLRRRCNPNADDPLFRPIDADDFRTNGESASDFSNLRQNGLVRITFTLPSNIKLIDPATNAAVGRDVRGRVAERADGQRRRPHRARRGHSVAARPERDRRIPVGRPHRRRCRSRRSVRSPITRRPRTRRRNSCSTTCRRFSGCCSRTIACARWLMPSGRAPTPLPDPDRPLDPLEQQGKVGVRARLRASATAAPDSRRRGDAQAPGPVVRFHNIASQCPRPVDTATPARLSFAPCPPQLARNARTYEITLANGDRGPVADELRSRPGVADRVRRRPCRPGRLEQVRHARASRDQQDRPVLPQQQRRHARGDGRSLHRVLQARGGELGRPARPSRRSRRPTACTSIGGRRPRSARRCWRTCASYSGESQWRSRASTSIARREILKGAFSSKS